MRAISLPLLLAVLLAAPTLRAQGSVADWSVNIGVLAEDPAVAETDPAASRFGTATGASDGPVLNEDKIPLPPFVAPPWATLTFRHPGDSDWVRFAGPPGNGRRDVRAPLKPQETKAWLLEVQADNGRPLASPRPLLLVWSALGLSPEIELRILPEGDGASAGLDMASTSSLTVLQTQAAQTFRFIITAHNTQRAVSLLEGPEVETSETGARVYWRTDLPAGSRIEYGLTPEYGQVVESKEPVVDHIAILSGLQPWSTYHYRLISASTEPGVLPLVLESRTLSTLALPITLRDLKVTGITGKTARVTWKTDLASRSRVAYGTGLSLDLEASDDRLSTDHAVDLSDLEPGTTYSFQAISEVPGRARGESAVLAFATLPPVRITNGPIVSPGGDNATLSWTTAVPATSRVEYGETEALGRTEENLALNPSHRVLLLGLKGNTRYFFRISSAAEGYASAESGLLSFTTQDRPVRILSGPAASSITRTSAVISYTTDVEATTALQFGRLDEATLTQAVVLPGTRTVHSIELRGLQPGTTYRYQVSGSAPDRGTTVSEVKELTTLLDPAVISKVRVAPGITDATVTYETDVPMPTRVEYGPDGAFSQFALHLDPVTQHSIRLQDLLPSTRYTYRVVAESGGRERAVAAPQEFTTRAPVVNLVGQPIVEGVTATSAILLWKTDTESSSLVEYGASEALGQSVSADELVTLHRLVLSDLSPGATVFFRVTSEREGLAKAQSAVLSFTTPTTATASFVAGYNVPDVANDSTGTVLDTLSPGFGATTGQEGPLAVDAVRGIAYVARNPGTGQDGRPESAWGVVALRVDRPLARSVNPDPSAANALSNYTDTGLVTVASPAAAGPVRGLAFDPVADRLFVLAGDAVTPTVYSAPGGTLGGAPEGGDLGAANPALVPVFTRTDNAGLSEQPIPGAEAKGLAALSRNGATYLYLAMGNHADVWSNSGGQWARLWSSALFPRGNRADEPVSEGAPVDAVTVDAEGNSYWSVRGDEVRVWQFLDGVRGLGQGFRDVALGGSVDPDPLAARPVLLESDGTAIAAASLAQVAGLAYSHVADQHTLWLSVLGPTGTGRPALVRALLTAEPGEAGDHVSGRIVDALGPGAVNPGDPTLATLSTRLPTDEDGIQYSQPAGPTRSTLPLAALPDRSTLWVNGFVRDAGKGQSIPTSAVLRVAFSPEVRRPFFLEPVTVTDIRADGVTLAFTTDLDARTTVRYGRGEALDQVVVEDSPAQRHAIRLTGLELGTQYRAQVTVEAANALPARSPLVSFETSRFGPGDGNQNGRVDIGDAVLAVQVALKKVTVTEAQRALLDVAPMEAGDGLVTIQDVIVLLRAVLGLLELPRTLSR